MPVNISRSTLTQGALHEVTGYIIFSGKLITGDDINEETDVYRCITSEWLYVN